MKLRKLSFIVIAVNISTFYKKEANELKNRYLVVNPPEEWMEEMATIEGTPDNLPDKFSTTPTRRESLFIFSLKAETFDFDTGRNLSQPSSSTSPEASIKVKVPVRMQKIE